MIGSRGRFACRTALCVPNCMHAAHHINQSFESFRFKETHRDRTAVSAPAYNCQRRISGNSSNLSKQLRQRNMDRTLQMIVTPFLGRSHIYNERAPRALDGGEKIASSDLRSLLEQTTCDSIVRRSGSKRLFVRMARSQDFQCRFFAVLRPV